MGHLAEGRLCSTLFQNLRRVICCHRAYIPETGVPSPPILINREIKDEAEIIKRKRGCECMLYRDVVSIRDACR